MLRDTNGAHDYFSRWGGTINGLHMLNGFDTNAQCVGGGTGGRFAEYLFPYKIFGITIRPALTVRNAWAQMAFDKEPIGRVFRSMGNIGAGGVTNINDHFWGQGSTGPDISKAGRGPACGRSPAWRSRDPAFRFARRGASVTGPSRLFKPGWAWMWRWWGRERSACCWRPSCRRPGGR